MDNYVIGIDPGISGAIALLGPDVHIVDDMPTMAKSSGKGNQVNSALLANDIREFVGHCHGPLQVVIEDQSAMPGQGVTGVFSLGRSLGIVDGVTAALGLSVTYVSPRAWKKRAGLKGSDKENSRAMAIRLWPVLAGDLARKKDHGRAEALLIAHFGLRE